MNSIFIDLEMHPVAKAYAEQFVLLKRETIEIGAVMLWLMQAVSSLCSSISANGAAMTTLSIPGVTAISGS